MVSVCLPSDALSQHLPSYLGFSYLGHGVSLHVCTSKAQPLLLTLDEGYLLTGSPPDLECGVAPLSPPAPAQPPLLGYGVAPLGRRPWPQTQLLCFIGLHRNTIFFFFLQNEGLCQPFYSAIFPKAFAYFVFLCNILIIISIYQTFPLLLDFLCDLWSVTFDVTIAERLQLTKGSDG